MRHSIGTVAAITALSVGLSTANITPVSATETGTTSRDESIASAVALDEGISALSGNSESNPEVRVTDKADSVAVEVEAEGLSSDVDVKTEASAPINELVESVTVDAVVDGKEVKSTLQVKNFVYLGGEDFAATLTDPESGESISVSSDQVNAQAFPILWVLGLLARIGIKAAIKQIGKAQIKKAAKSYLLNGKGVKWSKILAPKHKWKKVGAKSKQQVAEIMGKAMAEGKHSAYRGSKYANQAIYKYKYKGKKYTVVVTYAKKGGKIGDGWVK